LGFAFAIIRDRLAPQVDPGLRGLFSCGAQKRPSMAARFE
jgi:hypothetical protein